MRKFIKGCLGVAAALIVAHFALAEVKAGVFSECSPCGAATAGSCDPCDPCNPCDPCGGGSKGKMGGWEVGGWAEVGIWGNQYGTTTSYTNGAMDPTSGNTAVLQNVASTNLQLNQMAFYLQKKLDTRRGFDFGGRVDYIFGSDAHYFQSEGLELNARTSQTSWSNGDYYSAFSQMYFEAGYKNFSVKVGKFLSVLETDFNGLYSPDRFFYSNSYNHLGLGGIRINKLVDINKAIDDALGNALKAGPIVPADVDVNVTELVKMSPRQIAETYKVPIADVVYQLNNNPQYVQWATPIAVADIDKPMTDLALDNGGKVVYEGANLPLNDLLRLAPLANIALINIGMKPYTMTGAVGTWDVSKKFSLFAGWTNGENQTFFNDRDNAFVGGAKYKHSKNLSLGYSMMWGQSRNFLGLGVDRNYFINSLYFTAKANRWTYNFEWMLRNENFDDLIRLYGFGLEMELLYEINKKWSAGGRFEWMLVGGKVYSMNLAGDLPTFNYTLGVNWKPTSWLMVRPEIRWDVIPALDPFNGMNRNYQCSGGLSAVAKF